MGYFNKAMLVASAALCFNLSTFAQDISLKINNVTVKEAMEQLKKTSGYSFVFSSNDINTKQRVSVSAEDATIEEVVKQILKGQKGIDYEIQGKKIVLKKKNLQYNVSHKTVKVKGNVLDANGDPIIGATIKEKGTSNGTITDFDGNFSFDVSDNSILEISYIGYKPQELKAISGKELAVVLKEDTEMLDEVVVVGFGAQKKVNLTGAVSTVKMDEALGDRPLSNIAVALQGAVPGLRIDTNTSTPGSSPTFNIRGTTSINGGSPLVLVNNVPMDINLIDPQEIESVSILKDAASTAIYGARAAYGVILITTKQGKKDTKPAFNYNNNFSFSTPLELPQKASPLESVRAYKKMNFPNGNYVDGTNIEQWEKYILEYNDNPSLYPKGHMYDENGNLFQLAEYDMLGDMMDNFGFMQNHSLSVAGGGTNSSYRIGVGYTGEDGILITNKDKYDRINFSSFIGIDVTNWLTTQLDIKYANESKSQVEVGGRGGLWMSGLNPSYINTQDIEKDGIWYPAEAPATYVRLGEPRKIKTNNMRTLGRIILKPLKDLKITGEYTFNRSSSKNSLYTNQYKYIGKNLSDIMTSVENSSYAITQSFTNYNAINLYANYSIKFNDHKFDLMGGFNQESSHYESQYSYKKDVFISNLPSLGTSSGTPITSDSFSEYAVRGLFFRVNYNLKEKYLLEVNGRYDGSSRFPKNNRFGFFPSFSGAWRISEENFMKKINKYVSNLKLRASWGTIGNQVVGNDYPYIATMTPYLSNWLVNDTKVTSLGVPPMVSSNFSWEKVQTLDFALDFSLLNNRLNTTIEWYKRNTLGMLAPGMELPAIVGASAARQNAADLKTYGWELDVKWQDKIKDFGYRLGINIYDSQTEITKFDNEVGAFGSGLYRKGMKLGEIWGYVTDRFATEDDFNPDGSLKPGIPLFKGQGKLYPGDIIYKNFDENESEIYSGDNTIYNPGDQKIIGNSTPRYFFGITGGLDYKGFDFSFIVRGVGKRDFWRTDQLAWPTGGWNSLYKETLDFWSPDNPNAYYPRTYAQDETNTVYNRKVQTKYLANGAYMKIQNITLSYTLPKKLTDSWYLGTVKVYVTGENLYTFDHLPKGLEPESDAAWSYPFMRKYSFGFNISF